MALAGGFHGRIFQQTALDAKQGGLSLASAELKMNCALLGRAAQVLPYLDKHKDTFKLGDDMHDIDAPLELPYLNHMRELPYFNNLRNALVRLHSQSSAARTKFSDLSALLSASPTQHKLAEGVQETLKTTVLEMQDDRHRARLLSASGLHAGSWLCVFPLVPRGSARARHYQLALCQRLGMEIPELTPVRGVARACHGCGGAHDAYGFHIGVCKAGNRRALWTIRHNALESTIVHVTRRVGYQCQVCSVGAGNWLGAAAYDRNKGTYKRTDVVLPNHYGPGYHLFLDAAVADPNTAAARNATPSSSEAAGVAAAQRAARKDAKYQGLAKGVSGKFRAAVVERYGACDDALVGYVKMLCGDGDRDSLRAEDYCFSMASRTTYMASLLVFGTVIADACMLERVLELDTMDGAGDMEGARRAHPRQRGDGHGEGRGVNRIGLRHPMRRNEWGAANSLDVEGPGGRFWYEGGE